MKLIFENTGIVGAGEHPDFVQYPDTSGQVFYLQDGLLVGSPVLPLDGDFSNPRVTDAVRMTRDHSIEGLEMKTLSQLGIVGSYKYRTAHRLVICRYDDLMERAFPELQ